MHENLCFPMTLVGLPVRYCLRCWPTMRESISFLITPMRGYPSRGEAQDSTRLVSQGGPQCSRVMRSEC